MLEIQKSAGQFKDDSKKRAADLQVTLEGTLLAVGEEEKETRSGLRVFLEEQGLFGLPQGLDQALLPITSLKTSLRDECEQRGLKSERGMLLYGAPGTGKTSFVRLLGKYLGVNKENIIMVSGSELQNQWLGESEANIRNLFARAKYDQTKFGERSPFHIICIDEVDSIAGKRTSESLPWERSQVNELLSCIDGFSKLKNVLVVVMTNHKDLLDPALLRSGRFGVHVQMSCPNENERRKILDFYHRRRKTLPFRGGI